ncbi:MAG: porin [Phenylobacterium zucineum]|nr:MAG: porin [Phenylobacterium zucineum]
MIGALAVLPSVRRAHADETSDLRALVEAQSAEIRLLKQRLEALEAKAAVPAPAVAAAPPVAELPVRTAQAPKAPPPAASVRWSGTPDFVSADGRFRFKPRGRLYADASWTGGSEHAARNVSGTEMRALWMGFEGQIDKFNYILTADFANNEAAIRSAYIAWRDRTPAGDLEITLGNRLSERSLEGSSSSEGSPFMERNAVALAISPLKGLYGLGVTAKLFGDGWHVAAQVAGDDINNNPGTARDTVTTMVRAHWNPVRGDAGTLHVAAWGFHEAFSSGVTRLTRSTYWSGDHFNDSLLVPMGAIDDPSQAVGWGLELGGLSGPFWAFAEYGERRIDGRPVSATVSSWNVSAGWVLTDDRPSYATRSGTWVRTRPREPFSEGGIGAVELVGRVQRLDNTDVPLGGVGEEVSLGLNWKPEEWLRLMLNASLWRTENTTGAYAGKDTGQAVNTRLQVSF